MPDDEARCQFCGAALEGRDVYEGVCRSCREEQVLSGTPATGARRRKHAEKQAPKPQPEAEPQAEPELIPPPSPSKPEAPAADVDMDADTREMLVLEQSVAEADSANAPLSEEQRGTGMRFIEVESLPPHDAEPPAPARPPKPDLGDDMIIPLDTETPPRGVAAIIPEPHKPLSAPRPSRREERAADELEPKTLPRRRPLDQPHIVHARPAPAAEGPDRQAGPAEPGEPIQVLPFADEDEPRLAPPEPAARRDEADDREPLISFELSDRASAQEHPTPKPKPAMRLAPPEGPPVSYDYLGRLAQHIEELSVRVGSLSGGRMAPRHQVAFGFRAAVGFALGLGAVALLLAGATYVVGVTVYRPALTLLHRVLGGLFGGQ